MPKITSCIRSPDHLGFRALCTLPVSMGLCSSKQGASSSWMPWLQCRTETSHPQVFPLISEQLFIWWLKGKIQNTQAPGRNRGMSQGCLSPGEQQQGKGRSAGQTARVAPGPFSCLQQCFHPCLRPQTLTEENQGCRCSAPGTSSFAPAPGVPIHPGKRGAAAEPAHPRAI